MQDASKDALQASASSAGVGETPTQQALMSPGNNSPAMLSREGSMHHIASNPQLQQQQPAAATPTAVTKQQKKVRRGDLGVVVVVGPSPRSLCLQPGAWGSEPFP